MPLFFHIKNKYCLLYFANSCLSKFRIFFSKVDLYCYEKKLLIPCQMNNFLYFSCLQEYEGRMETYGIPVDHFSLSSLGVNLASSPHIINSRQVRKYSPLCSPQSLGSINSYILHIHDLQTGQKILLSLQSSVPWEYKLIYTSYS
jgi:hypothetical protein